MTKQKRHLTVTYPHTGSTKSLTLTGDTIFDFYNGKITYPDGTTENIQKNLKEHGFEVHEGIYISVDQSVTVEIGNTGKRTFTNKYFELVQFDRITITTTVTTALSLIVSTNPSFSVSRWNF